MRPETLKAYEDSLATLADCPPEHDGDRETHIPGHGTRMICRDCTSAHHRTSAAIDVQRKREGREDGEAYWAGRGIKPGATVYVVGSSMLGPTRIKATAKVGVNGAYVTCNHWQTKGKQLHPDCASTA